MAWRWSVCGTEAQVSLTVAFSSSKLLGLVSLIFLLTILHRFSMTFRSGEFDGQSSTVTPWSLNQLLFLFLYLSHTQLYREYITSSEMYSLHLTHPKWTHTQSSGQPCYSAQGCPLWNQWPWFHRATGEQLGVRCLAQGPQSWYWRRILQQSLPDLRFEPTTFRLQVRLAIH